MTAARRPRTRTLAERREWRLAGAVTAHALPRAQVALALQVAAQNHADAEGVDVP